MPKKGDQIEFDGWNKKFQSNVTGFLDFETVQIDDPKNPEIKTLKAYHNSLVFVDKFDKLLFERRGFSKEGRAGEMCLDTLLEIEDQLFSHARRSKKMKMSKKVLDFFFLTSLINYEGGSRQTQRTLAGTSK